ncbi:hypothetical protein ACJ73_08403, partial [Blastomyces percursus]
MENSPTNPPPTTPPRYAAYSSLKPSRENRTKENDRNGQDMDKDTKNGRKMSVLALLGKLSKSRDTNRSQSPFSPPPYSSSSTPPWRDSTTAPRLSNPLSPPTSTSLVSINLKPAEYVRRIKRLLTNSKRPPPFPLPQSPPHPPSPGHVDGGNGQQNIPNGNGFRPSAEGSLQRQNI